MRVPTHLQLQKLVKAHRGDKRNLIIRRSAAPLMYLQYLLFMKKVAREADLLAFSQQRQFIREWDVKKAAKKVLSEFSLREKIGAKKLQHMTSEGEDVETHESDESEKEEATTFEIEESSESEEY